MKFVFDDGGRQAAGFAGMAGDCVCRSIAIASGRPYAEIYKRLADGNASQRRSKRMKKAGKRSARNGIYTRAKWFKDYMRELGAEWHPTMLIGSGCKVHLADGELPMGRLVVSLAGHYTAVIDGEIHDTFDPQRTFYEYLPNGGVRKIERCVYGYWKFPNRTT